MLVIEIFGDEKVFIDATKPAKFSIKVTRNRRNRVALGFDAPAEVKIVRERLLEKDQAAGRMVQR